MGVCGTCDLLGGAGGTWKLIQRVDPTLFVLISHWSTKYVERMKAPYLTHVASLRTIIIRLCLVTFGVFAGGLNAISF